jgi:hypothetical protein
VADASAGIDQLGLAVDHGDDLALGAGMRAGPAADAFAGIDQRVQRRRLARAHLGQPHGTVAIPAILQAPAEAEQQPQRHQPQSVGGIERGLWIDLGHGSRDESAATGAGARQFGTHDTLGAATMVSGS